MLVASGSLFWTLLKNLDMLGLRRAAVLGFTGEFGHVGRKRVTGSSPSSFFFFFVFFFLIILLVLEGLRRVSVLELIGEFGHVGSQEGHCFGTDWRVWTRWVSGGSLFWN